MRAPGSAISLLALGVAVGCAEPDVAGVQALVTSTVARIESLATAAPADPRPALSRVSAATDFSRPAVEGRLPPSSHVPDRLPPARPVVARSEAPVPRPEPAPETIASPETAPPATDPELDPSTRPPSGPLLVATSRETPVLARPSPRAPRLGYLRAGAVVSRDASPVGFDGCRGGFYRIAPEGYVCAGSGASLDGSHELARAGTRRADRSATLPYVYGITSYGAPLYSRVPSEAEQRIAEPDLDPAKKRKTTFDELPLDSTPWFLEDGAPSISPNGTRFSRLAASLGSAKPRSGMSFLSLFESAGRRFGLTGDMAVVPLDRFTRVEPSRFHGLPLDDRTTLPVAFVRARGAYLFSGDPERTGLRAERKLEFREAVPLTGKRIRTGGKSYLETRDGAWIEDDRLLRVDPMTSLPAWATGDRTWIDVSITKQALVAYRGKTPVFVTLVSTGIDGTGDPETTHSTIQGQFLVHTKHVTVTMDSDAEGDEYDLRDVPYVQYFKDGFALHAAYWHDGFGAPRSHGCVNLSPLDARFLFSFTDPPVPTAWHGAMSTRGTLVWIHA
ncbi:MAG TPA: L,D-transpeptidase family protein [Polyangiaceae bacterium]|nr:L,D-transpeptidase family protein [Polyangiaceae bacterium]